MTKKIVPFFATHGDLVTLAREVIESRPVEFVISGMFAEQRSTMPVNVDELDALQTYLVVDQGIAVNTRVVPQRSGGELYAIDQLDNPHAITMQTGGRLANEHLIAGQIGTVGNSRQSDELYASFAKVIRRQFKKVKSFYVGPEAAAMLSRGARLSATPKSPKTYDLTIK